MDIALDLMINEEIRDRGVGLIDENGEQLGVMPTAKAMELAEERGLGTRQNPAHGNRPLGNLRTAGLMTSRDRYEESRRERENREESAGRRNQGEVRAGCPRRSRRRT